jgi:hypothetical protein
MRNHGLQIGDLISLDGSVYGSATGVVIDFVDPDVRIVYTAEDGTVNRIRRRGDTLTVVQKKQNGNE